VQQLGHLAVDGGHALARVDDERHDVGLVERAQRLLAHGGQDAGRERIEAARVDDAEAGRAPLAHAVTAIARDARLVLDQRGLPADQPVEQRRLADVRPAQQRDQRQPESAAVSRLTARIRSARARPATWSSRGGP
jgi:hypothetical protein